MSWRQELQDQWSGQAHWSYDTSGEPAAEPAALTALALAGEGRWEEAEPIAGWLVEIQSPDGTVGIRRNEPHPYWPTGLAVLVWSALRERRAEFAAAESRGVRAIVAATCRMAPRFRKPGDETAAAAWPWVEGTYSWVEPTSFYRLALRSAGWGAHERVGAARRMLLDRQLPSGGWNYGNAIVLDQLLRAHVQPTGIALLALSDDSTELEHSIAYLRRALSPQTTTQSLSWGLLGLAAHGQEMDEAEAWLERAFRRTMVRDRSPLKLALLGLAAQGAASLAVQLPRRIPSVAAVAET